MKHSTQPLAHQCLWPSLCAKKPFPVRAFAWAIGVAFAWVIGATFRFRLSMGSLLKTKPHFAQPHQMTSETTETPQLRSHEVSTQRTSCVTVLTMLRTRHRFPFHSTHTARLPHQATNATLKHKSVVPLPQETEHQTNKAVTNGSLYGISKANTSMLQYRPQCKEQAT